jgi:hypothetical protein
MGTNWNIYATDLNDNFIGGGIAGTVAGTGNYKFVDYSTEIGRIFVNTYSSLAIISV